MAASASAVDQLTFTVNINKPGDSVPEFGADPTYKLKDKEELEGTTLTFLNKKKGDIYCE